MNETWKIVKYKFIYVFRVIILILLDFGIGLLVISPEVDAANVFTPSILKLGFGSFLNKAGDQVDQSCSSLLLKLSFLFNRCLLVIIIIT